MFVPTQNFESPQDQEIVCLMTGESYVHLEGGDLSLIDPKYHNGAIDVLPTRFFKQPWIIRKGDGQIRVFGSIE